MIATYIQELLATNNRVIIPNYGAFLVRATSKSKDANTLEEKLLDIYFSPFLKFNDELLEKYIIQKEGITKEQAADKILEFINEVKKELDKDKPYNIKDFGYFSADKQGKVQFTTFAKEQKGDQKAATKPIAKVTPESGSDNKKSATTSSKKASSTKEESKKIDEKKPASDVSKETAKPEIKEESKKPASGASRETAKPTPKIEAKPTQSAKKKEETKSASDQKTVTSYKKEKKTVNKGLIWAIAIGLPVAAIFVWGLLDFDTVKKIVTKDKVKTEKVDKKKTSVKKETAKIEEEKLADTKSKTASQPDGETEAKPEDTKSVSQAQQVAEQKPAANQKKYYIIAGSFKNEKYAESYLSKLKTEGYSNAEKLGERNGMYAVSFNSFVDKRKAIAEYKFLSQEKNLQAWILYY